MLWLRIFLTGVGLLALAIVGCVLFPDMEWNRDQRLSTPDEYAFVVVALLLGLAPLATSVGLIGAFATWMADVLNREAARRSRSDGAAT